MSAAQLRVSPTRLLPCSVAQRAGASRVGRRPPPPAAPQAAAAAPAAWRRPLHAHLLQQLLLALAAQLMGLDFGCSMDMQGGSALRPWTWRPGGPGGLLARPGRLAPACEHPAMGRPSRAASPRTHRAGNLDDGQTTCKEGAAGRAGALGRRPARSSQPAAGSRMHGPPRRRIDAPKACYMQPSSVGLPSAPPQHRAPCGTERQRDSCSAQDG